MKQIHVAGSYLQVQEGNQAAAAALWVPGSWLQGTAVVAGQALPPSV